MSFSNTNTEYATYMTTATALEKDGDIPSALRFYHMALDEASKESALRMDMSEYLALANVGRCYAQLNDFDKSVDYNIRAVCVAEKLFGKDGINIFLGLNDLAVTYEKRGMLQEAHGLYLRSLSGKIRTLGENDESTLMTMQELGNIKRRLNNLQESRILLERAYIGYENLKSPNEEMAYSIITNISAVYNQMGLVNQEKTLLRETIPRMAQSLGLVHRATAGSIYNFLLMERTSVPSTIIAMVQEIQEKRYETGRPALEQLAGYYYETNQVRKAVGLMETLAEWGGIGVDKSMSYLSLAGVCHSLLDNFDKSCEKYELMCKRAPLIAEAKRQNLCSGARAAIQDLRKRQRRLLDERAAWRLNEPQPCACGTETTRLCSGKVS